MSLFKMEVFSSRVITLDINMFSVMIYSLALEKYCLFFSFIFQVCMVPSFLHCFYPCQYYLFIYLFGREYLSPHVLLSRWNFLSGFLDLKYMVVIFPFVYVSWCTCWCWCNISRSFNTFIKIFCSLFVFGRLLLVVPSLVSP